MNQNVIRISAAALLGALGLAGCENMSPQTTGVVAGTTAGILAGTLAKVAGASDSTAVAIGLGTGAAVGVMAFVIAKHEATERQRRYAEERARLDYERMSAQRKAEVKKRRYIAVPTVREKNSTGAQSVMVYDTQSQQVIGNNVYDLKSTPKDGQVSKFDTVSAEYVGTGA
jgi:hypothetical protein